MKGVALVFERAQGVKCARSWKILAEVGSDPEFPELSPRDAEALRARRVKGLRGSKTTERIMAGASARCSAANSRNRVLSPLVITAEVSDAATR